MKVLVTYFSKSGNTEKLAKAIYDGVERKAQKDILPLKEVQSVDEYDLIFCGFPVHSSSIPVPVEKFIKNKDIIIFQERLWIKSNELQEQI